nr:hypothetical protein [Tanacetum cinerariifolium]
MEDVDPIRTLLDYSKPSHKGYRNTIELPEGNNVHDPSPHERIILLISLLNSFYQEGLQNFASNNIKENLSQKHGLISRTYSKKGVEERNGNDDMETNSGINGIYTEMPVKEAEKETGDKNGTKNKPIKRIKGEETAKGSSSQFVEYYLKHRINENLIERLIDNHRPARTDIRLFLASNSYIYPLGIVEDLLVDVVGYVYPMDFVILDIKEDKKRPFILGIPFVTTAKAVIKFDKGTITLKSKKSEISFNRIPESLCKVEKEIKDDIEPVAPTMIVNRPVREWE